MCFELCLGITDVCPLYCFRTPEDKPVSPAPRIGGYWVAEEDLQRTSFLELGAGSRTEALGTTGRHENSQE